VHGRVAVARLLANLAARRCPAKLLLEVDPVGDDAHGGLIAVGDGQLERTGNGVLVSQASDHGERLVLFGGLFVGVDEVSEVVELLLSDVACNSPEPACRIVERHATAPTLTEKPNDGFARSIEDLLRSESAVADEENPLERLANESVIRRSDGG